VVGTVHNVQVPGYGVLVLDAGNIVFDFSGPAPLILFEAGPHQFIREGYAAVCAYFVAP
jgi:hypothetical protein